MERRKLYLKIATNLLVNLFVVLFCIFILPKFIRFFFPFVLAWIISMIANPLVRFMEKRIKIVRKHSSAIIIIVVLVAVIAILYGVCSFLIRELVGFMRDIPDIYNALSLQMDLFADKLSGVYSMLPQQNRNTLDSFIEGIGNSISTFMTSEQLPTFSDAGDFAKNIADVVFSTIIVLLSSYFFIADRDKIVLLMRKAVPNMVLDKFDMVVNNFKQAIGGYFRAQFKLMLIVLAILFVGFSIMDVNYAILLALAVAFLDLLPFFGTGAVLGPWAVYNIIIGRYADAIFLVIIYLLCQVIKQVLQPKMVGDSIGISPLSTLFFMFIGYKFGGLFGLIIGIPIGMVIVNFYHAGMFDDILRGIKIICRDIVEFMKF